MKLRLFIGVAGTQLTALLNVSKIIGTRNTNEHAEESDKGVKEILNKNTRDKCF